MSRISLMAPVIAITALAGCTATQDPAAEAARRAKAEAEIADTLKGLSAGEPQSCIDQTRVQNVHKFNGTIIYEYSPRDKFRNDVGSGCFGLGRGDIIVSRSTAGQLCRGEIISLVSPGSSIPSGTCSLGDFVPYTK